MNIDLGCTTLQKCIGDDPRVNNPVTEADYKYALNSLQQLREHLVKLYYASISPDPSKHKDTSSTRKSAEVRCRVSIAILSLVLLIMIFILRLRN